MKLLHKLTQGSVARPLISSHTILLLCGVLFGLCLSEASTTETTTWFLWAGVTGLISFLGLHAVDQMKNRERQLEAIEQTEQRLTRHAQLDPNAGTRG